MYIHFIKPVFDFIIAFILLLFLSPVFITVAILVYFKLGSPVLFLQPRPGKNEKIFCLYKFRTMTDLRDHNGVLLPDSVRITKFGNFLRRTSLDELPQFLNVLKGNASLVGPRPLLVAYLPLYNEQQKKRHLVKPGITGWAQVNGRNALTWEDKFILDIFYVENISFFLDVKIIFMTFSKVFNGRGITTDTGSTMDLFKGTK